MPSVLSVATALPPHVYSQHELERGLLQMFPELAPREKAVHRLFDRVGVESRHLALPLEVYAKLDGMEARSRAYTEVGVELATRVVGDLLEQEPLEPADLGALVSTTITGVTTPSLGARVMNRLPELPVDLRRVPLFGLGCLGGAAGLARVADYLRAHPDELAILLSVELCSLTVQPKDVSMANLVSTGLFGDGAAAVLVAGDAHPLAARARGPRVVDSRSAFFRNTEQVMGWNVVDSGFEVVLSPDVPDIAEQRLPSEVEGLLQEHGLRSEDVEAWVSHPGGPKVMDAIERGLSLPDGALDDARASLADVGNLSSASVLFVLERWLSHPPSAGAPGVMLAMGPGFCAELLLLEW